MSYLSSKKLKNQAENLQIVAISIFCYDF